MQRYRRAATLGKTTSLRVVSWLCVCIVDLLFASLLCFVRANGVIDPRIDPGPETSGIETLPQILPVEYYASDDATQRHHYLVNSCVRGAITSEIT